MLDWTRLAALHNLPLNESEVERAAGSLTALWKAYEPLVGTLKPMEDPAVLLDAAAGEEGAR